MIKFNIPSILNIIVIYIYIYIYIFKIQHINILHNCSYFNVFKLLISYYFIDIYKSIDMDRSYFYLFQHKNLLF